MAKRDNGDGEKVEVSRLQFGCHVQPCDGEAVSGDAVVIKELRQGVFLRLVDVLGHGREAAQVAILAIRFLKENASKDIGEVLTGIHEHLQGTRGAAISIAFANHVDVSVTCTGIGNTMIRRIGTHDHSYPSPDGIVGIRFRTPRISQLTLGQDDLLLLYSDGVAEDFSLVPSMPLFSQPVAKIARRIVLDHGKLYDDPSCIAVRYQP